MKNLQIFTLILFVGFITSCGTTSKKQSTSQNDTAVVETTSVSPVKEKKEIVERPHYNPSATILTDLIHTTLHVSFDWEKSQLNGVAEITASPYFYATDSLILDAKTMDIHSVQLDGQSLNFIYNDNLFLRIGLDREYTRDEQYTVVIEYTAKPEEKELGGSSAISADKGLYFINPRGEDPNKIPQIWTQGETEASSVWFPTIDRPNQKMTQEIFMTVDDKYVTLSNGRLVSQTKNEDGTRTDHWKQELPHVPYLAAMFVGEFSVVEDVYIRPDGSEMPVHYYVEPEWEEYAKDIFGATPEMIKFFSELLGVEFPWDKYHQVVVRDYVSGAMENTGAVIFGDFVYKTRRELIDANDHSIIAHELFHHWFGDLVTCESWANLPLNESFANYSQYLWDEYYYGKDEADYNAEKEASGYFQSAAQTGHHDMIWYDYDEKEDMFDAHSYNKGGRILHMLRNYLGDDAFFTSIQLYLTTHAYKPVEIHHLRLAFEEISGEDLNWFFDQWFFGSRYPELKVVEELDSANMEVVLTITQEQDLDKAPLYKLPMTIALFDQAGKTSYPVIIDKSWQEFRFPIKGKIKNIIVDEDRVLLGAINHKKPHEYYVHQFYNAPHYKDREEGISFGSRDKSDAGKQLIFDALEDDFWYIRQTAIGKLSKVKRKMPEETFERAKEMAKEDPNSRVRSAAVNFLANEFFSGATEAETRSILENAIVSDSSYMVVAKALNGLTKGTKKDVTKAIELAETMQDERSSVLRAQVAQIYATFGGKDKLDYFTESILQSKVSGYDAIGVMGSFTLLLKNQEISTIEEYLPFFMEASQAGSPYVNAVLPMNLMILKRDIETKIIGFESDIEDAEEEKNQQKVDKLLLEKERYLDLMDKVNKIIMEVAG